MNKPYRFTLPSIRTIFTLFLFASLLSVSLLAKSETIAPPYKLPTVEETKKIAKQERVFSLPKTMSDELFSNMVLVEADNLAANNNVPCEVVLQLTFLDMLD